MSGAIMPIHGTDFGQVQIAKLLGRLWRDGLRNIGWPSCHLSGGCGGALSVLACGD
jgi:hypothetical protein